VSNINERRPKVSERMRLCGDCDERNTCSYTSQEVDKQKTVVKHQKMKHDK